jgi:hypothetical protein
MRCSEGVRYRSDCGLALHGLSPFSAGLSFGGDPTRCTVIPPGVATAQVTRRTVRVQVSRGLGTCPPEAEVIGIHPNKTRLKLSITRDLLTGRPSGWLTHWTAELEETGCVGRGSGELLAGQIAEALPIDYALAFHLLYSDQLDITPDTRIQVVSPLAPDATHMPASSAEARNDMAGEVSGPDHLVGYEVAWYRARRKAVGTGVAISPFSAERRIGAHVERESEPSLDYFTFPPDAAFFRVLYKSTATDYAAIIIAAKHQSELDRPAQPAAAAAEFRKSPQQYYCRLVPVRVAITGFVPVQVNQSEVLVPWRGTVGEAIRLGGEPEPESILAKLAVYKRFEDKPIEITIDHNSRAILKLPLVGGEIIRWR